MANNMVFFKIGNTDLTQYVDIQNYDINEESVFEEWQDGNWVTHRVSIRTRKSGTVVLGFKTVSDFNTFVSLLSSQRNADGYYSVTAYINNTGATATFNAFVDTQNAAKWDLLNNRQWLVQTLTVFER